MRLTPLVPAMSVIAGPALVGDDVVLKAELERLSQRLRPEPWCGFQVNSPIARAAVALVAGLSFGWAVQARAQTLELPTFHIVAKDGRLQPNRLEVPAGKKIKLTLANEGRSPVEFENLDLRVEKVLGPGAVSFVVIHPLKPGSYRFVDEFHAGTAEMLLIAK